VAGCFDYGNEPSGLVKYGKIVEPLATSQARLHSTEPYPNWLLRSTKLALCIMAAFTAVPIDSLTLSLQP
jgi:hypothetical protein